MAKRNKLVIDLEKNVSCLPGYETFDTASLSQRMPKRIRIKSVNELLMEKDMREGKLNLLRYAV